MSTFTDYQPLRRMGWPARAEAWMDARGKGAWIAAMVVGFIAFWPLGLALLAYMFWGKQMFRGDGCGRGARRMRHTGAVRRSSGNTAFDAYKAETLRRLEDEQDAFEAFLDRLRAAKDKSEFDQFMDDRARKTDADGRDHEDGTDEDAGARQPGSAPA
ncbi:DUF2852 domain-containing protein [Mesobaculum littorinae]|uniref:DUF2852 domain-containing protein n=1 Tax=Mesobaculum littorinae TaxID=2486419 RepID=A0A438AM92_9RHOB|nr:DUF2852 domain-containing protein [Mesobaculum littorinae]RVV99774.1 DUF2852 domain-containing protein [Mesobaculum littorinae]